jgi:hypothetical protein
MKYNPYDNVTYCTNAERTALDVTALEDTGKYYEVDTGNAYIVYNKTWYSI